MRLSIKTAWQDKHGNAYIICTIKADAWDAILLEQREDYAENEYARPDFKLTVINREQALRLYDEGKQIYLVRISPWPVIVTDRTEIERGSDTFQIATADLEQERSMTEQENMLLYGSEKQFGIYQITERDPEHDYRFMGLDYVEKKGMTVARADYDLIYAAPLTEKDTLDGIYERFNIQRPADFTGHSLSVSDVVVLNDGSTVKAYYVDSIGFAELPDFFKERSMDLQKENLLNEKLQEIEIFDKPGLFSNGRLRDEDVPEGLYRYDLRGSDYDPGQPITVEKTVVVNHAASVLMAEELDLGAEGRLELGEEGLNFTGAELTVREFMEEQQQKNNVLIHGDSDHITVEGHIGTWYAVDETEIGGEKFFLLEHEEHGDMAACVAVNEQGKLVAEDLWNGFDEDFQEAVQKYLSEKWNMPKKEDVVSEIIEKAAPVPDNSAQDYSDVPVYYEPFSYAKENDEVDLYRMLNDENVPVPSVYNKENKAYGKETTYTIAPVILWDSSRVWKILTAYVYTGAMVLGKTKTLISGKSIVRTVPKGQQFITEGTHEAIVSREEFEKAQLVIKSNSHKVLMGGVDFPLKGKVRCGNCRRVMAHNFKQVVPTFWCREGLELVGQTQCTSEILQVSDIESAVFQALKKELSLLDSLYGDMQKEELALKEAHKKANRRKTLMEQELKNLKGEKMRMYEEYAAGTLPLDTYKQKKQECDRRISEVQEQIEQSKAEESAESVVPGTVRAAAEQAENFLHGTRLTAGMVSAFIENVFVHDGGRIVVRFKYEQSIQDTVKALHTD